MNSKIAGCLVLYGGGLIGLGWLGYRLNPADADGKTVALLGRVFGALALLCGVLGACNVRCGLPAAITTTVLLVVGLAWMGGWGWLAVMAGDSGKLWGTLLLTAILTGSGVMLPRLLKA